MAQDSDSGMESQEGGGSQEGSQLGSQTALEDTQAPQLESPDVPEEPAPAPALAIKESQPEKAIVAVGEEDNEPDETLAERLWGLTEMFPESVRNATSDAADCAQKGVKSLYAFSRSAFWIVFSTSIILFAPVMFEVERAQMEEMQRSQQKQMLLGPNTAVTGGGGMPLMPPIHAK